MSGKSKFSKDEFVRAIKGCCGVKSRVARRLDVSRTTVGRYLDRYPDVKKIFEQMREEYLDELELAAAQMAVEERNPIMIIFLLKTLGKDRGYVEKLNVDAKCENSGYMVLRPEEEIALFGKED